MLDAKCKNYKLYDTLMVYSGDQRLLTVSNTFSKRSTFDFSRHPAKRSTMFVCLRLLSCQPVFPTTASLNVGFGKPSLKFFPVFGGARVP